MVDHDGEWMTWAEAAERLGIKPESVQRRARARRWARRTGNDGRVSVKVPASAIPDASPDVRADIPAVILPDQSATVERAIRAEARAEAAEKMLENVTEERDRWRQMAERLSHREIVRPGIIGWFFGRKN